MTYKKEKNLLGQRDTYNKCYSAFRGVDFSNDHTQVDENRFAYAVNMYKDYQTGEGQAIETIPGFRIGIEFPERNNIFGIHCFEYKVNEKKKKEVLVHYYDKLYWWINYPSSVFPSKNQNKMSFTATLKAGVKDDSVDGLYHYTIELPSVPSSIMVMVDGVTISDEIFSLKGNVLTLSSSSYSSGDVVEVDYIEAIYSQASVLFNGMNMAKSTSFVFNNKLYIIDGKNYLVYDGETVKSVEGYIPTTYRYIIPAGENADNGKEYEQRNLLSILFKNTFVPDGVTTEFYLSEKELMQIYEVRLAGEKIPYSFDRALGKVVFGEAPKKPEEMGLPEGTDCLEITASKEITSLQGVNEPISSIDLIRKCTIATVFDNRVFLSGNPACPNHIFFCSNNNKTGYIDPSYWGILNYKQDGVGISKITGMIPVADTLMVLKEDSSQEGCVFYHTRRESNNDIYPVDYPSTQGLNGIGCLGACTNFLDDPVFVSHLGLEAIGQLSARYERAIEHRSSMVDAKLVNSDLANAVLEEWNGYLLLLVDGKIFMADSRQKYTDNIGNIQYEWYYLEDIGIYENQYPEFKYTESLYYDELLGKTVTVDGTEYPLVLADEVYNEYEAVYEDLRGTVANSPGVEGNPLENVLNTIITLDIDGETKDISVDYIIKDNKALLCSKSGSLIGGQFKKATILKVIDGNILFGTENGYVCIFNFDKRDSFGVIGSEWYSFNNRTIFCGCATKMDCCGIPHLTKNTVKKSTVIKTKAFRASAAKVKVRTNKNPYKQIGRINNTVFDFSNVDFSDLSFNTTDQTLFAIKEKEKQWIEKQYFVYSDEYLKPFALYYIAYRYNIVGRFKG
ncbi:MAG: hypothetical protein J6A54_00805 [Clostridia bacterium]|nr:hypothetical protein [Clostridia bacterium]